MANLIRVHYYHTDPLKPKPKNPNHSPNFNFPFKPHPSVAPPPPDGQTRRFAACKGNAITLQEYIETVQHQRDFDKHLFVQIAYAMRHIHEAEKVMTAIGHLLSSDNFKFSEDIKTIVLANFTYAEEDDAHTKRGNISALGGLFDRILNGQAVFGAQIVAAVNRSSEPEIANHLILRMQTDYTADQVLRHPYFWSATKKLEFLRLVWHLFREWRRNNQTDHEEVDRLSSLYEGDEKNWRNNLLAEPPEDENGIPPSREAIQTLLNHLEELQQQQQQQGQAQDEVQLPQEFYNGSSAFDLLRFIRNCFVHFWDRGTESNEARKVFRNHEGLWRFFNAKFPDLFVEIYSFAFHSGNGWLRSKLGNEFTDELAKSEDLL